MHQPISDVGYNLHLLINLGDDETGGTLLVDTYTFDPGLAIGDIVKIADWKVVEVSDTGLENRPFSFSAKVMDIQKVISWHQKFEVNIILESPDREVVTQLRDLLRARNPEQFSSFSSPTPNINSLIDLDPWTQSLIGVIQLGTEEPTESYVDYLEEKYS